MHNDKIFCGKIRCLILITVSTINCLASWQSNSDELKHTHVMCRPSNRYATLLSRVVMDHENRMASVLNQTVTHGCSNNISSFEEFLSKKNFENIQQESRYVSFFVGRRLGDVNDIQKNAGVASCCLFNKLGTL